MRSWMLLLLGLTACGKSAATVAGEEANKSTTLAAVTDAERRRMEAAVDEWAQWCAERWEQGDSAALMTTYPASGPLMSVTDGRLDTTRASVARYLSGLDKIEDRKVSFEIQRIDVLAPGLAAVTLRYRYQGNRTGTGPSDDRGLYTAVLAERGGHLEIVQEHQSASSASTR